MQASTALMLDEKRRGELWQQVIAAVEDYARNVDKSRSSDDVATYLDAYGFDVYAFDVQATFNFGKYRAVCAPGGDYAHSSVSAH